MSDGSELWHGGERLGTLLEDVPCEIVIDKTGVASTTMHYQCFFDRATALLGILRTHPTYPWLVFNKATISREEAGMARVAVAFEGVDETEYEFEDEEDRVSYSLEGQEGTEPIETHPNFVSVLAGDYQDDSTWKNGAKFVQTGDDAGRFLGFMAKAPAEGAPEAASAKAGVRSFIDGGFIYTETKVYNSKKADTVRIDMNRLYKIDVPPKSKILPKVSAKRNWLLVGCSVQEVGRGMRVTKRWRLSGANGWDEDIYTHTA